MAERTPVLPEQEDQFTSFLRDVYSSTPEEDAQFQRFAAGENAPQLPTAPGNLQEVFSAGIESGVQGLAADLEYFKALGNTLMGDEQAAALNIQEARLREEFAAAPVQGLDTFEQFLDQPTFGGFIEQAIKSFGQVLPSAALSIAGAGTGAIAGAVGRGVLNQVNKQVAKRIIKDSVERTANGVADPVEQQIAELAYGSLRTAAKRGAIGGAFAAEYAPMSGSNLSEALEAGQPLDQANALRAAAIGVPQAAIGVGSEYALLKLIGEQATKRAAVEGGVFANFAKRLGTGALQGGAIEATTEVAQEGISVANRADLDPLFTAEDAKMRLAEAAFAGFFGGAAPGGAGGAIGGTLDATTGTQAGTGLLNSAAGVFDKARRLLDSAREQRVNRQINDEQFGDIGSGYTTPEAESDINAQIDAMLDDESQKQAVWVASDVPKFRARVNAPQEVVLKGYSAYAAFIPGRGTIVSTDKRVVEEVIAAGASDQALQIALGYSAVKNYSSPSDLVVQVRDRNGRVVSEEVTSPEGREAAYMAALKLKPKDGRIEETTVEKALEDRKRRFEAERPVEVREIDFSDEQLDELRTRMQAVPDEGQVDEADPTESDIDTFGQGVQEVEGEVTVVGQPFYKRKDPNATYENTAASRAAYEKAFGKTDWSNPRFAAMGESMLRTAADAQLLNRNSVVEIEDLPDGSFRIVSRNYGELFNFINKDGSISRLNLPSFIQEAVKLARQSKYARTSRVTIVAPDGKKSAVNLVDLTAAGQRLLETREGTGFQMRRDRQGNTFMAPEAAARDGLQEMLGELAVEGYDIQIDGQSLFPGFQLTPDRNPAANNRIPKKFNDVTAAVVNGKRRSLGELLRLDLPKKKRGSRPTWQQLSMELQLQRQRDLVESLPEGSQERDDAEAVLTAMQEDPNFNRDAVEIADPNAPGGFRERDQQGQEVADGRSEIDRMIESSVEGDEPPTRMNIDTPRSAIDRRAGSAPSTINPERAEEAVSSAVDRMVREVIRDLIDVLKLQSPPRIYTLAELTNMSVERFDRLFPDPGMRDAVQRAIEQLNTSTSKWGIHVSGPSGKVIVFKESGNTLQDALVVAHEIGHSLYKEERDRALTNKALRTRLLNAYRRSSTFKALHEKYGFDGGFEEWFSDQVALWAGKRYKNRQANNMVEKYFKDFVARLSELWRATSSNFQRRFNVKLYQDFETFMDAVLESRRAQVKENGLSFTEKAFVYELNDLVVQNGGQALAAHWRSKIQQMLNNPKLRPLMKLVRTADGVLRMYAGNEIADMFYTRSQEDGTEGRLGMLRAAARKKDELQNQFEDQIGSLDDPQVMAAMEQAASSTPTTQLTGKARQIREFLDSLYDDYIGPSNSNIGRQTDYFPVALNLMEIYGRPHEFIDLVVANNPSITRAAAQKAVDQLVRFQQAILNHVSIQPDPTNPSAGVAQAILLTRGIPRELMQDAGFLQPPNQAFINYIRQLVKRVEFDRATKDADGNSRLEPLLARLNPEDRAMAEEIIGTYLGYQANPLSPFWRKLNSWGQFIQFVTILPFATISSLTDLAGPIINSKEFGGVTTAFKEIAASIKNRKEAEQFARDIGVVTNETVANAWVTEAEQDYMDPKVRKMSDTYFKAIGLSFFTRFSREFAAGMGVQFITKHARNEFNNPRSERYLRELGLTREDVMAWMANDRKLSTPEGQKVKQALQRFVESSILRPNAAERPLWASDPHWALVWQLKAYFYSYAKVILGGIRREAGARLAENGTPAQKIGAAASVLALTAVATMPLAMLGMELREYAKFGLAWLLPGVEADQKYFRSDRMDWPEYAMEVFDRSGFTGPLAMAAAANQSAEWGNSPLFTLLGPTAETIDEAFSNGWRVDRTIKDRLLPVYSLL